MRPIFSASAALLLAGTMLSGAAWAQTAVTPRQEQAGLPAGPYLLSCTHPHRVNGQLVALCDSRTSAMQGQDTWQWARLSDTEACTGDVENVNGRLICGAEPMVGSSMPPEYYGSSFGNSGSSYASPGAAMSPYTLPNQTGKSAYLHGQPVPPANKPYTSSAPQAEWSTPPGANTATPHSYGSWQQPVYHPENATQPVYEPVRPSAAETTTPRSYGSWQQPAYHPENAAQPVYEPVRPSAAETTTPPSYGSWQVPAYHPAVPPAP